MNMAQEHRAQQRNAFTDHCQGGEGGSARPHRTKTRADPCVNVPGDDIKEDPMSSGMSRGSYVLKNRTRILSPHELNEDLMSS